MIYLTSNGLTSKDLKDHVKGRLQDHEKAVLITTASMYKHDDHHVPGVVQALEDLKLKVDLMDIEVDDINMLSSYDVIYFLGGNPFYLLHYLRVHDLGPILKQHLSQGKMIIGASAGSIVLTPSVGIVHELDPHLNIHGFEDLSGLELVTFEIIPHYSRFKDKYQAFESRVATYGQRAEFPLYALNDGEGYYISPEGHVKLGGCHDSVS